LEATVAKAQPNKIDEQIKKAGLPTGGQVPFVPRLDKNRRGEAIIRKAPIKHGPKRGMRGFVDTKGRIWIKDRAHANVPDHWDVQEDDGKQYIRVDLNGDELP